MSTLTEKRNLTGEIQEAFQDRGLGRDALRQQAFDLFLAKGLPGSKSEEYKFTPVTRVLERTLTFNTDIETITAKPASLSGAFNRNRLNHYIFIDQAGMSQ